MQTIAPLLRKRGDRACRLPWSARKARRALTLQRSGAPLSDTGAELAANIQEKCWDDLKGPVAPDRRDIPRRFASLPAILEHGVDSAKVGHCRTDQGHA